jgi:hypothetical protein
MTIVEFLEARITEDEARATSGWARRGDARWETNDYGQNFLTPSAILAECAAKRAIIGMHETYASAVPESVGIAAVGARCGQEVTCDVLRALAAVYKDHSDHDPQWAQ